MYEELSDIERIHLAIDFHLNGSPIPIELSILLGASLVEDITNPIVSKDITHEHVRINTDF